MSDDIMTVVGPRPVSVAGIDKELAAIWKTLAPPTEDESQPLMQASVVNLVAVCGSTEEADAAAVTFAGMVGKTPCRFIVLDSQPHADPPDINAHVSVLCVKVGSRQICCEHIRINAKGISADSLPSIVESFYAPDLPILVWWATDTSRPDMMEFAAAADRLIIDTQDLDAVRMEQLLNHIKKSREMETTISDLNWARLTPYRQLFTQFFDPPEPRNYLGQIESVNIEATETTGILLNGWMLSCLDGDPNPYVISPEQISVSVKADAEPVLQSLAMKCKDAEFSVAHSDDECVEVKSVIRGETTSRIARIMPPSLQYLLSSEVSRAARDRGYEAAIMAVFKE